MTARFVLLASMRTGSNLLNSYLNQYEGLQCHGEAFNPSFVGLDPEFLKRIGWSREDVGRRDEDPMGFLRLITGIDAKAVGLHMFPGHNRSILNLLLEDRAVRKLCLRRSVIHSFISLQSARKTDIWRTTNRDFTTRMPLETRRVQFDPAEFERYRMKVDRFWKHVFSVLSETGQEHYAIWYRQLNDVDTINKVVKFIGLDATRERLSEKIAKQNPEPLRDLVENWDEMVDYAGKSGLLHQI